MHGLQEIVAMNEAAFKAWQVKRFFEHLKRLVFNDWCSNLLMGALNHNSSDRDSCYNVFEFHVQHGFDQAFKDVKDRYEREVQEVLYPVDCERDKCFPSYTEMDSYATKIAGEYLEWTARRDARHLWVGPAKFDGEVFEGAA
jgi:hypothetical protein